MLGGANLPVPYTLAQAAQAGVLPSHLLFLRRHAMHAVLTQRRLFAAPSFEFRALAFFAGGSG
jgi:hypothetical protein